MKCKYLVKRAMLHAAERNPYRPRQKVKRGKWIRFAEFDDPSYAEMGWPAALKRLDDEIASLKRENEELQFEIGGLQQSELERIKGERDF